VAIIFILIPDSGNITKIPKIGLDMIKSDRVHHALWTHHTIPWTIGSDIDWYLLCGVDQKTNFSCPFPGVTVQGQSFPDDTVDPDHWHVTNLSAGEVGRRAVDSGSANVSAERRGKPRVHERERKPKKSTYGSRTRRQWSL
jgi:hypothetical protein